MTSYTAKSNYPYPDPTDAVTDYPATASTIAGYLDNMPNRNAIINGCFDIWQRGTIDYGSTSGTITADRWRFAWDGAGGTRTLSRESYPTTTTIAGMTPRAYMQIWIANRGSATTQTIGQRVEGVHTFAGETITFSAYAKVNSGTMTLTAKAVQNFGTGGSPSTAVTTTLGTQTVTTTWARIRFTTTLPSIAGKTIGTGSNDYVELQFDMGTATGILSLWGVQLEQNSTATALERRPIQQELALCQRYYQVAPSMLMRGVSSSRMSFVYFPPVIFRATPSLTLTNSAGVPTTSPYVENSPWSSVGSLTGAAVDNGHMGPSGGEIAITGTFSPGISDGAGWFLGASQVRFSSEL